MQVYLSVQERLLMMTEFLKENLKEILVHTIKNSNKKFLPSKTDFYSIETDIWTK